MEGKEEDDERARKSGKQKNTRAAVSFADKSRSKDKVGTNMLVIVFWGPRITFKGTAKSQSKTSTDV